MILYGYTFEKDGTYYEKAELNTNDYRKLAEYIFNNPCKDKMITDIWDLPVLTAFGFFINQIDESQINRELLLTELSKLESEMEDEVS